MTAPFTLLFSGPLPAGWLVVAVALVGATLAWALRRARYTARALAAALTLTAALHAYAGMAYGTASSVHAGCAAIGLSIILPIALRARRTYPLVVAAGALVALLALSLGAFLDVPQAGALRLVAGLGNLVALAALWYGIASAARLPAPAPVRSRQSGAPG